MWGGPRVQVESCTSAARGESVDAEEPLFTNDPAYTPRGGAAGGPARGARAAADGPLIQKSRNTLGVSPPARERALRLLHVLFRALERRGFAVRESEIGHVSEVTILDVSFRLFVGERNRQVTVERRFGSVTEWVPSGRLFISTARSGREGITAEDSRATALECLLNRFVARLIKAAAEAKQARAQAERDAKEREERERERALKRQQRETMELHHGISPGSRVAGIDGNGPASFWSPSSCTLRALRRGSRTSDVPRLNGASATRGPSWAKRTRSRRS